MELARLIAFRDNALKAQVQNIVFEDIPESKYSAKADQLDKAFDAVNKQFKLMLEISVGHEEASRIWAKMNAPE